MDDEIENDDDKTSRAVILHKDKRHRQGSIQEENAQPLDKPPNEPAKKMKISTETGSTYRHENFAECVCL